MELGVGAITVDGVELLCVVAVLPNNDPKAVDEKIFF